MTAVKVCCETCTHFDPVTNSRIYGVCRGVPPRAGDCPFPVVSVGSRCPLWTRPGAAGDYVAMAHTVLGERA